MKKNKILITGATGFIGYHLAKRCLKLKWTVHSVSINLPPNKECIIQDSSIFLSILKGDLLFESLYTGYLGKWKRYPADIYNQDVITIIVMFSYFYRNVLVKDYIKKFV